MRVAPVAFVAPQSIRDMAISTSALTHGHRAGQEAAAAWALILRAIADGAGSKRLPEGQIGHHGCEVQAAILRALQAPRDGRPKRSKPWAVAGPPKRRCRSRFMPVCAPGDFEEGLRIAVTHGGDSDSTGAIAGNALGLLFPDQVLAHRWARQVECADLVERLSRDLALTMSGHMSSLEPSYPGW